MIKKAKNIYEINAQLIKLADEIKFLTPWSQKDGAGKILFDTKTSNSKLENLEPFNQYIEAENVFR